MLGKLWGGGKIAIDAVTIGIINTKTRNTDFNTKDKLEKKFKHGKIQGKHEIGHWGAT